MMNTYVLIAGNNREIAWYELVEEYSEEKVESLASKFSSGMARQYLNGRKGLDSQNMNKFLWQFISNVQQYLKEGRKLLFNRAGGMMFLDDHVKIMQTKKDLNFPYETENFGLSGWLSPTGEFHPCEHGEHWKFASQIMEQDKDTLHHMQYVSMGSVGNYFQTYSHLFIPIDGLTTEQQKWFEKHYPYLDVEQKKIYDQSREGC